MAYYFFSNVVFSSVATASTQANNIESTVIVQCNDSQGAGFLVKPNLYMTARHVIDGCKYPKLFSNSGETVESTVAFLHPELDIALLTVDESISNLVEFSTEEFKVGTVEIVGAPIDGLVLSIGKINRVITSTNLTELYLTVPADFGNSGGPVFLGNKLLGMVYQKNFSNKEVVAIALSTLITAMDQYEIEKLQGKAEESAGIRILASEIDQTSLLLISISLNLIVFITLGSIYFRNKQKRYILGAKRIVVNVNKVPKGR